MKALIIDDNQEFCTLISKYLSIKHQFEVDIATDQKEALTKLKYQKYDVITLDVELGNVNGIDLLPKIRSIYAGALIIISCHNQAENRISGLRDGADDYMVKPILFEELYLRISKLIPKVSNSRRLEVDDYSLDINNLILYYKGNKLSVSAKDFRVLELLLKNKGKTMSRETIYSLVWGSELYESRIIDMTVARLRKVTNCNRIKTVRGKGYIYE